MNTVKEVLESVRKGDLSLLTQMSIKNINESTIIFLKYAPETDGELDMMRDIIEISNILYNNTDRSILPLEDGVYDLLVVKYNKLTGGKAPVGALPIQFKQNTEPDLLEKACANENAPLEIVSRVQGINEMLFFKALTSNSMPIPSDFEYSEDSTLIEKKIANVAHVYPELVGSLDKYKFVLNSQAAERGLLTGEDSDSILIFERDFLYLHYSYGIMANQLIAELKYDGVSIEAEVEGDTIISARSRGDTDNSEASDLTPIFGGYVFERAKGNIPKDASFGIKFEAIITYYNLQQLKDRYGKTYANARNAIIGLLGSLDARKYRDFITLVPLAWSSKCGMPNRQVEIEFLNKYYSSGVNLRYDVLNGDYASLLFQVKRFVEEAEYMRPFLPFMYDGVVVSYTDPSIIQRLGRVNSVNKYSAAIKFNALKKQTVFTGYTYSIGQNGLVTPMANFNPIEFMGAIHYKTTAHSLSRVRKLGFRLGDIADVELRHDVICYITKPDNSYNRENKNPIIEFVDHCPSCGDPLMMSDSGDSVYCVNFHCPERNVKRMSNMLKKLNIKDFSTQAIRTLGIYSLADLLQLERKRAYDLFGEVVGSKLMERIEQIKNLKYADYRVIGSIGFSSIASEKWKLILANMSLEKLINGSDEDMRMLSSVKGIGRTAVNTIILERGYFLQDLIAISKMPNIQYTYGEISNKISVRFTGGVDKDLEEALRMCGFDADGEKSVTKQTNILIVPYRGYKSNKVNKIGPQCKLYTVDEAWNEVPQHVKLKFKRS
jgi:NAD-dependent DNA ligase